MNLIENALRIATDAHEGQVDKAGKDYIEHPVRVSKSPRLAGREDLQAAALLHDVIEDTPLEAEDLLAQGIPENVVEMVDILSRRPHPEETYRQYIGRVAQHPGATLVKLADLDDNSSPERRIPGSEGVGMHKRYRLSYEMLGEPREED